MAPDRADRGVDPTITALPMGRIRTIARHSSFGILVWPAIMLLLPGGFAAAAAPEVTRASGTPASERQGPPPSTTGPARYLFLDPALLEQSFGAEIKVSPAQRSEVVIRPDRPWEKSRIGLYLTVLQEAGKLRMWYICRDAKGAPNVAYAESTDGIEWTKPNLGIVDYEGSRDNNLVGISSLEGTVFKDPNAPDTERYSYVTSISEIGMIRYKSPDGWHWTADKTPLLPFTSDTQNVTFWDERERAYVLYVRGWEPGTDTTRMRYVARLSAPSITRPLPIAPSGSGIFPRGREGPPRFHRELPIVLACDAKDPARTDIYNISAQPYPLDRNWYVGFPSFYRHTPESDDPPYENQGFTEVHFVGGRDGVTWHRYDRAAYSAPALTKKMTFMGTGVVIKSGEIWQYGTEFQFVHKRTENETDGAIIRYTQRLDGFVALTFGGEAGAVRTRRVKVTGNRLRLNLDTGALGELRVGLLGPSGPPVPGFEIERCDPLEGTNALGVEVSWKGQSDLSKLAGQELQLEFRALRTRLFSFRFE